MYERGDMDEGLRCIHGAVWWGATILLLWIVAIAAMVRGCGGCQ